MVRSLGRNIPRNADAGDVKSTARCGSARLPFQAAGSTGSALSPVEIARDCALIVIFPLDSRREEFIL